MTVEERLDRIEHITAGLAEQFRSDREENRQLWHNTQRQIVEVDGRLGERIAQLTQQVDRLILESAMRDKESRDRDAVLGERMDKLVVAMGEWISRR